MYSHCAGAALGQMVEEDDANAKRSKARRRAVVVARTASVAPATPPARRPARVGYTRQRHRQPCMCAAHCLSCASPRQRPTTPLAAW